LVSTEPIPDSVFAIPAEYKLVSAADLSREAMEARAKQAAAGGVPGGYAGGVIGGIIGSVPRRRGRPVPHSRSSGAPGSLLAALASIL
jgi:hypothetical protein